MFDSVIIRYNFYDGPPFATGLPHYGHILAGTIKDIVTRFAHQSGFHVDRRFGWDCHGLPVVRIWLLCYYIKLLRIKRLFWHYYLTTNILSYIFVGVWDWQDSGD